MTLRTTVNIRAFLALPQASLELGEAGLRRSSPEAEVSLRRFVAGIRWSGEFSTDH
jgi:hypothetical protein